MPINKGIAVQKHMRVLPLLMATHKVAFFIARALAIVLYKGIP